MARTEAVIFDLGRVLVRWDISEGLWARLRAVFGSPGDRSPLGIEWERLYDGYARGRVEPRAFHREFCRLSGFDLSFESFATQWCDIFTPIGGMDALLAEVAASTPVGLLSDTDPLHWAHCLDRFPWLKRIGKPTLSFETGALKPEPATYLAAADALGLPADACFFTDDLAENVEGALRVGMDAVQFRGIEDLRWHLARRGIVRE